jgi:hypothetical protein
MDSRTDNVANWSDRLSAHFAEVRRSRQARATELPVFALEHGLNQTEISELSTDICGHLAHAPLARKHELAAIVYAAEIGYRYSGDQYWQTFEAETPGWKIRGDRSWLRDCFRKFHDAFGGAAPSGSWAEHFTIISWPITHAILPRDLQQQLARILYELRGSFSAELFESPQLMGDFIKARSWKSTSRFQNLAEQPTLLGQIAAALLLQGNLGTNTLIDPGTLRRIGDDIDRERRGRDWLKGARRFAEERATIRGLSLGKGAPAERPEEARADIATLGIEPRLVLRPADISSNSWEVSLEIPDLSHLMLRFPNTRDILSNSRCIVAGASGRPLARGRCLHGPQRVLLSRWPRSDEVLLQFENTEPQLEYLLRTEFLLRPGPRWLFKIASDGLAYETRGLRVRAGERYLLVSTAGPIEQCDLTRSVVLACDGVHGLLLELPDALTPKWEGMLRRLGVSQAKSIEVWPAGLAANVWDGEGRGEWIASERPCIALRTDHFASEILISMKSAAGLPLKISDVPPGETIFVELPPLAVGLHKVGFSARTGRGAEVEPLGDLDLFMRIREARPWSPGVAGSGGPLSIETDPAAPTIEQLWEDQIEILVSGPEGRPLRCCVSMFEREEDSAKFVHDLPVMSLPLTTKRWRQCFDEHLRQSREAQNAYDEARLCELQFFAEELGTFTVRCEREFTPLRWTIHRVKGNYIAHLHEDVGGGELEVFYAPFAQPTVTEALEARDDYSVPEGGGLYVARLNSFMSAIIVPPVRLEDLRYKPRIDDCERSVNSLLFLNGLASLWERARLPGDVLSAWQRRVVLHALVTQIFRVLGGACWGDAEANRRNGTDGLTDLKRAISHKKGEASMLAAIASNCERFASSKPEDRAAQLALLIARYVQLPSGLTSKNVEPPVTSTRGIKAPLTDNPPGADNTSWLVELALRLGSDPARVASWAGKHLPAGLARLIEVQQLARAARFLVLAIDQHLNSRTAAGELYAGWRWS